MPFVTTNDNVKLHYVSHGGGSGSPIILVHGWSGSHRYFDNSIEQIGSKCNSRIIAYDLRFHGDSDKPSAGFHVARLAADLNDLILELKLAQPVVVGTSLGCAIIWAYIELYGNATLGGCVFVDQAPSQWTFPDWKYGSKGIYDPASLLNIQNAVRDMPAFAKGNAECCLTKPVDAALMTVLTEETLKCDPEHLGKLMADHACASRFVPRATDRSH
jgi:non-heme chloroperoxidase